MKRFWFFFKFSGGFLLIIYSFLALAYLFISTSFLLVSMGKEGPIYSESILEQNNRWLFSHPTISFILMIMIIPGLLIKYWDRIKKGIERRREENNSFYIKPRAEYRKK